EEPDLAGLQSSCRKGAVLGAPHQAVAVALDELIERAGPTGDEGCSEDCVKQQQRIDARPGRKQCPGADCEQHQDRHARFGQRDVVGQARGGQHGRLGEGRGIGFHAAPSSTGARTVGYDTAPTGRRAASRVSTTDVAKTSEPTTKWNVRTRPAASVTRCSSARTPDPKRISHDSTPSAICIASSTARRFAVTDSRRSLAASRAERISHTATATTAKASRKWKRWASRR